VTAKNSIAAIPKVNDACLSEPLDRMQTLSYFLLTLLGFSFWFFMAVPFASHRETYWWLAMTPTHSFATAFSVISVTYRPLAQAVTWLGFVILDSKVFPTSILRQALFQGLIYGMFGMAWWLIYRAAPQRRPFALIALVAGGVFFPGYVHLFHIYGIMYVPVMITLGVLLRFYASRAVDNREVWLAVGASLLAFWHPFATALFVGFYFGFYLETFHQRSRSQHVQAFVILLADMAAIAALAFLFPRGDALMPLHTRLFGFLVSYQTNEVNFAASLVAFLLTQMVFVSMRVPPKLKLTAFLIVSALSGVFLVKGLPLLLLWLCAVLVKLFQLRTWSLFFLTLTAMLLPFGGGIGSPVFALFAIIIAVYVTPLGWFQGEKALSFLKPQYVTAAIILAASVLLTVRNGVNVPIVTKAATPLLTERERTYQLESILAWLHKSAYCHYDIGFVDSGGNPTDSPQSAITRKSRPPSSTEDVHLFWDNVLRCDKGVSNTNNATAILTFDSPAPSDAVQVFTVKGRYAGDASVWVRDPRKIADPAYSASIYRLP
jgi:hypothetical protein